MAAGPKNGNPGGGGGTSWGQQRASNAADWLAAWWRARSWTPGDSRRRRSPVSGRAARGPFKETEAGRQARVGGPDWGLVGDPGRGRSAECGEGCRPGGCTADREPQRDRSASSEEFRLRNEPARKRIRGTNCRVVKILCPLCTSCAKARQVSGPQNCNLENERDSRSGNSWPEQVTEPHSLAESELQVLCFCARKASCAVVRLWQEQAASLPTGPWPVPPRTWP